MVFSWLPDTHGSGSRKDPFPAVISTRLPGAGRWDQLSTCSVCRRPTEPMTFGQGFFLLGRWLLHPFTDEAKAGTSEVTCSRLFGP